MNRSHKILQDIYYSLHPMTFDDEIQQLDYQTSDDVLEHCMRQWTDSSAALTFPSKSINVAVIYARLLEHYFGNTAIEYLQDPHLLFDLDRFYLPLPNYETEYAEMLDVITFESISASKCESVQKTVAYFHAEFLIGSCEYQLLVKKRNK